MELEKSKRATLARIIEYTGIIIQSSCADDTLKGYYSQVQKDWNSLKDRIVGWNSIIFQQSDLKKTEYCEKFSTDCKTKITNIKAICENNLADMDDEIEKLKNRLQNEIDTLAKERAELEEKKKNYKTYKLTGAGIIIGIISIMLGFFTHYADLNYKYGYSNGKSEYTSSLDSIKYVNAMLSDSITSLKSKILELENKWVPKRCKR